jgi:arylsulfatase A-like enzyme
LLCPPETHWDRETTVPEHAQLTVGYGVQATLRTPIRFEVTAIEPGGREHRLFSDTVRTDTSRSGRWHDAVVDLGRFAGRAVTLRLSTAAVGEYEPSQGMPVWANPEVVAPRPRDGINVVIVLLDTLRADRLSCYGHDRPTSPHIDRWAAESAVRFSNTVAPAPWTLPSHASIFTGLDAVRHGFNYWGTAPASLEMLAEALRSHGYTTAAVTGGGILQPRFGFAQGFDRFDAWGESDSTGEISWVFDGAIRWLRDHSDRRFFLFVHTYEPHYPHRRRQPFFDRFAAQDGVAPVEGTIQMRPHGWKNLVAPGDYFVIRRPGSNEWQSPLDADETATVNLMYDSAVATADREVGRLLDELRALDLKGRTLVVVTSDHGEALGEDGRAGHAYLEDYNLMVPLIIELPGGGHAGAVIDRQVRLIDLMPTILETVGIDAELPMDGRSLLPLISDSGADFPGRAWAYAASSNLGLAVRVENRLKYVFPDAAWAELADSERLYDLVADPTEHANLAPDDSRLPELRTTTTQTILDQHRGLRLLLRNSGSGTLEGRLVGAWASHDRVKTSDHDCRCVHWKSDPPGSFVLHPGQQTDLLFHQLPNLGVGLVARVTEPAGAAGEEILHELDLSAISTPAALYHTPSGWRFTEGFDGIPEVGFLVTRVGDQEISSAPPETTTETIDQLRALGYVQ